VSTKSGNHIEPYLDAQVAPLAAEQDAAVNKPAKRCTWFKMLFTVSCVAGSLSSFTPASMCEAATNASHVRHLFPHAGSH